MEKHKGVNKRLKILINASFQLKFTGYFLLGVFLSLGFFYLAKMYYFKTLFEEGISLGLAHNHIYFKLLLKQEIFLHKILIVTLVSSFIFLFIFGLILSNRIAGPLYRLNDYFKKMSQGEDTGEMKFRKNDFFRDLPPNFNAFRDSILKKQKEHEIIIKEKDLP